MSGNLLSFSCDAGVAVVVAIVVKVLLGACGCGYDEELGTRAEAVDSITCYGCLAVL